MSYSVVCGLVVGALEDPPAPGSDSKGCTGGGALDDPPAPGSDTKGLTGGGALEDPPAPESDTKGRTGGGRGMVVDTDLETEIPGATWAGGNNI